MPGGFLENLPKRKPAKKAPLAVIDERGQEGASHADEGGNICRKSIRQENATTRDSLAGRTSIRYETVKHETILPVRRVRRGRMVVKPGSE